MKAIIFNTEKEAKEFDKANNHLPKQSEQDTQYWFTRRLLKATTTLTKAEYAELFGIPDEIPNGFEEIVPNPEYDALEDNITLNKCALIVGEALNKYDEDGNHIGYHNPITGQTQEDLGVEVIEITEDDFLTSDE